MLDAELDVLDDDRLEMELMPDTLDVDDWDELVDCDDTDAEELDVLLLLDVDDID